jgi:uncharacterized protein YmfQ (DUF2313 family)
VSHSEVLTWLFPLGLTGVFAVDAAIEGEPLDAIQARAEQLLGEMFPDNTYELLMDWERVCGLKPASGEPLQSRRDAVITKLRERGSLSRSYFVGLATAMGYMITIDELQPFMCGWGCGGDTVYIPQVRFIWRVNILDEPMFSFRAGQSATAERLLWWPVEAPLIRLFRDLKPAHTYVLIVPLVMPGQGWGTSWGSNWGDS